MFLYCLLGRAGRLETIYSAQHHSQHGNSIVMDNGPNYTVLAMQ